MCNKYVISLHCLKDKRVLVTMKKSELIKRLREAGCFLSRQGSGHEKWTNPKTGKSQFVPRHAREVATGTAHSILRELVGE